ncbi:MAG: TRAP transporter large permease [Limnochordia bacterium]
MFTFLIQNPWVVLFGSLFVLVLAKVPMAVSLAVASLITLLIDGSVPVLIVVQRLYAGTISWILLAIPFFMMAGAIMEKGGVTKRIVDFCNALIGFLPGGLAAVNIAASMVFGGISGSAVADTSAIGTLLIPAMCRQGYSAEYSAAVTASSSPIGMIIPPSIPMVLYSFVSGVSVGGLFLGGVIPGILTGLVLIVISTFISCRRGYRTSSYFQLRQVFTSGKDAVFAILAPAIIIGGIVSGVFTPTEAASVAVAYSLFVTMFIYQDLAFKDLPEVIMNAVKPTALVMFIVAAATVFSWTMSILGIGSFLCQLVTDIGTTPSRFLVLLMTLYFILGLFLDISVIILLVGPVVAPLVPRMGLDPFVVGIMSMVVLATGLITPPLGLCLFVASSISGVSVEKIAVESIPFLLGLLFVALIVWLVPWTVTFIPAVVGR